MAELPSMLSEFREAYHVANYRAAQELSRSGWDLIWDTTIKSAARDLMLPNADAFLVRRRLEELANLYRRCMCDPVRLFASMEVQDALTQHLTALEAWHEEHPIAREARPNVPSTAWLVMLENQDVFCDWVPGQEGLETRLPWNLYANPHAGMETVDVMCPRARRLLMNCALVETKRLLEGTTDPEYKMEVWMMCKEYAWVDVDRVAGAFCGYTGVGVSHSFDAYEQYREPLMVAEQTARRLTEELCAEGLDLLHMWLRKACRCNAAYLGLRFPPCFIAWLCDIIMEHCPFIQCGPDPHTAPHPCQMYPVWVRFGILHEPELPEITQGWEPCEQQVLTEAGNQFTSQAGLFGQTTLVAGIPVLARQSSCLTFSVAMTFKVPHGTIIGNATTCQACAAVSFLSSLASLDDSHAVLCGVYHLGYFYALHG